MSPRGTIEAIYGMIVRRRENRCFIDTCMCPIRSMAGWIC